MLCQKCGKNPATTHVKRTVGGKTTEYHLCAACAAEQGFGQTFSHMLDGFSLGDFWGSLFAEPVLPTVTDSVRCEGCGKSFREIASSGRAGCPSCYTTFYDRLLPSIQRIHGKTGHVGKVPSAAGGEVRRAQEVEELRRQLNNAIANQEYEKCAGLRDRIRELEGGESHENQ